MTQRLLLCAEKQRGVTNMRTYYLENRAIKLHPNKLIGEGGEAEIYQIDRETVIKFFKPFDHPNFKLLGTHGKRLQDEALRRLNECQEKLPRFPRGVTPRLVEPDKFLYDRVDSSRQIVGYTMPLITPGHSLHDYAQRTFRESSGIGFDEVIEIFEDLHKTLTALHAANIVVGDLNPFNVLISNRKAFLIDADSMQFSGFRCNAYSPRYADPLILRKKQSEITMVSPHSEATDWYAYAVLLMECLLYVHPYGGVYKPANGSKRISPDERPLHRISILNPEVKYPSSGVPLNSLPAEVQWFYECLLKHDRRSEFPHHLFSTIHSSKQILVAHPSQRTAVAANAGSSAGFTTQTQGLSVCPNNLLNFPNQDKGSADANSTAAKGNAIAAGGTAYAQSVFSTNGVILKVAFDEKNLRYLYHDNGKFIRENGQVILNGKLDPSLKFALHGSATLCGKGAKSFVFKDDQSVVPLHAELYRGQEPVFDSNSQNYFFVQNGQLFRGSFNGPQLVDEVFSEQTRIWMGTTFGFGFFMAGEFRRAFLFDNESVGRTVVDSNVLAGYVKRVQCRFSDQQLWLIVTTEQNGQIVNRVAAINRSGKTLAIAEDLEGSGSWTDFVNTSSCAASFPLPSGDALEALLIATTSGVVQIETNAGQLLKTKQFDGTANFVQSGAQLLFARPGLFAWNSKEICLITTKANK
jgi:serine/threonine protein kinase